MKLSALSNPDLRISSFEFTPSKTDIRNSKLEIRNPEEAAKSFEKVLVQQFVNVMTEQMFKSNLSGDDGPGWMKAYGDTQRQVISDVLTDHLVDSNTFNLSSLVMQHWQRQGLIEDK